MSLSDIYNPKEGYDSMEYSWVAGNSMKGLSTQNQHHTAEAKAWPMQRN